MKFFKNNVKKKVQALLPRDMEAIKADYNQLSAQAANTQYLVFVHSKELEQINNRLLGVNQEALERKKLDEAKKDPKNVES